MARCPALVLVAIGFASLGAAKAQADAPVIHTWPTDPSPCDASSTLQGCISSAAAGDTVQIATNAPILESISFQKSLALQAAPGFHPLFPATRTLTAQTPSTGSNSITIEGLTLVNGFIDVVQNSTGPLTVAILGDTIQSALETNFAIKMIGVGSGAVALDISGNTLTVPAAALQGIFVGGNASGRIAENTIVMHSSYGAIQVGNTDSSPSIDVIANRISATAGNGILFEQDGLGTTTARILDNLVIGQGKGTDGILLEDTSGTLTATVANNTVTDWTYGIITSAGGALSGLIANNIASGNTVGISATLPNRSNLVFGNGDDVFTPGPGTVTKDPQFVDPAHGNYHVKLGSPAIDAGDDGSLPADLMNDLDGNPRIQGGRVDIGAFEAPGPSPAAAPRSFTGELQIEMGGSSLAPSMTGHGTAVLNTSVAPPSFVVPTGAFVAKTDFVSFLSLTKPSTRQLLTLTGQNAQGTFDSQARKMPFSGLLRFKRVLMGSAFGAAIDAGFIGAPGMTTVGFPYPTVNQMGSGMLTGQSFQVSKDSRTPAGGGHIQLVAPFAFTSSLSTWSGPTSATLALDFAPEPNRLALGALAIAVLCCVGVARSILPGHRAAARSIRSDSGGRPCW